MPNFQDFRKDNVVTQIPVQLPYGKEVYYKDQDGLMRLYVGDENGVGNVINRNLPTVFGAVWRHDSFSLQKQYNIGYYSIDLEGVQSSGANQTYDLLIDTQSFASFGFPCVVMVNAYQPSYNTGLLCAFSYVNGELAIQFPTGVPNDEGWELSVMVIVPNNALSPSI